MWNASGAQARLAVKRAAEVILVGKDAVLFGQKGAATVDEVDDGQVVLRGDVLRADVLFHRLGIKGAALDGSVVGDEHAGRAVDDANARDDACAGGVVVVHAVGCQGGEFEEGGMLVDAEIDAVADHELAAAEVAFDGLLAVTFNDEADAIAEGVQESLIMRLVLLKEFGLGIDMGLEDRQRAIRPYS